MKKASTRLPGAGDSNAVPCSRPHPAESSTENLHWDWYSKRGHFSGVTAWTTRTIRLRTFSFRPIARSPLANDTFVRCHTVLAVFTADGLLRNPESFQYSLPWKRGLP